MPYPAGGGNDVLARLVAEKMSKPLGQSIVVENRGGAGGTIATRQVAKARRRLHAPDRARARSRSILALSQAGYDPRKDFARSG